VVSQSNHEIQEYHHRYLYAGDNIVAIYDNDTDELLATLLHEEGIDTPLSISLYTKPTLSTWEIENLDEEERYLYHQSLIHTYYYHRDHQNSIIALIDKEGKIIESYSYDPYGNITHHTKTLETYNPYGYTGREIDTDDLYYYRARYYDPTIGRFITPDPIGFAGGDTNFYRYVGNDPVNFTDPSGLLGNGIVQNYSQNALSSQQGTQRFGGQTLADALRSSTNRQNTSSRPTDGVMVRNTQPEVQQVTHGYFYDHEGKFLGNNGTENVVYAADAKASSTEYTNPIKLALTHTEFQTASAIVKHEGITNDKKEYLWIAHASKNAADNSGTTIYGKLMSGYSSVPNGEKIPLPTTSSNARSNYARAGVIHALLKEDPTNGASLWDGTDFLAWGLHSPNGTPQNKFEEYKTITIDVGIYETFLSNTLVAYPNHTVNYYGQAYNIPDEVFTDPSNWTVDKFIYNTNQNVPKSLTATGTAGRSIFWRKH
jgi:RHS repeat-associated protein